MPLLSQFSDQSKLSMLRNATWTLSNFCRGKPQPQFEQVCHSVSFFSLFCIFIFVIISFCRYITSHVKTLEQVKAALPALAHLIHINDEEVLTDACWALSYLSDGVNEKIQAVIESGVCPRLVELLL